MSQKQVIDPLILSILPVLAKCAISDAGNWRQQTLCQIIPELNILIPVQIENTIQFLLNSNSNTIITEHTYVLITFGSRETYTITIEANKGIPGIYLQQFIDALAKSHIPIAKLMHDSFMYSPKNKNDPVRRITGIILTAC